MQLKKEGCHPIRVNSLSVILSKFHFCLPRTVPIIIFVQLEIKLECVFHKMFDCFNHFFHLLFLYKHIIVRLY